MNRYTYVEGAPESFVDVLGFFRAAAALQAQKLAALNAAFQSALDELNQIVASQARLPGAWSVAQMMASYNQFHASDDPIVRAAMDQIAREAFYGVTDYKYQQKVQVALAEQAQKAHDAWVVQEKIRVRAAVDANVAAYNQANDRGYLGGLVDTLSIAGHGVVNFGSGVVNFASSTVNLVVDVVQTTSNAVSPLCWTKTFCSAIPDIPSIPVYGDPSLYQYSQMSGYATTMAAEFVLTGGVGALKSGTQVVVSGVKVVPRLVTELPAVVNEVKTVVKAVVPALREALPLIKSALSGAADDIVAIMQAPGEFAATLKTGLNNPITTPGGIFGTPATASGTTAAVETTTSGTATATSASGDARLAIEASTRVDPWGGPTLSRLSDDGETVFRVWGGESEQVGSWLTPIRPTSSAAAIEGLALPPSNAATYVSEVRLPAGVRLQVGPAGKAFDQVGGWTQIELLERIPASLFGPGEVLP
jgi:hypothetical protein